MADIELVIKIPEKEFGIDIDDKFQDFFSRLKAEIKAHLITNTSLVCGAYELETIDMFLKAFNNGVSLLNGHGRLSDIDELVKNIVKEYGVNSIHELPQDIKMFYDKFINSAPTILDTTFDYKLKNYAFFRKEGEK